MTKILSGINDLDNLIDSLYAGDNVVWEVEAGTSSELFLHSLIRQSFNEKKNVIYISFNKSPQTILQQIGETPSNEGFTLLDCFTAGKGKNDKAFIKFYENCSNPNIIKVDEPGNIPYFTTVLNSIEDSVLMNRRYIFDSLTGMQDLWGDENSTYKFFTYMCPRLYDLGTVAYWVIEKEAHSQAFKANLRHITQVVLELYKRKDKLYIKALKLDGRSQREAFKPHPYEINLNKKIIIAPKRKEPFLDIGSKIKELRTKIGISQKELADKVDLTPSFISQLENNQISPSLSSFMQICNALGVTPGAILEEKISDDVQWLIKKEKIFSHLILDETGLKGYMIARNGSMSGTLIILEPHINIESHFIPEEGKKLIYVLRGDVSVVIDNREKTLRSGDSMYLKEEIPSLWKNEGGDKAELLLLCS
jgi:transcriptional regulator with XRE-family HTH domain/KaiC/GvpD/RAD55 family RecA-like ATPase